MFGRLLAVAALVVWAWPATAADLSKQTPVEVRVELGSKAGELEFVPNELTFETGKLYKLVLENPSPSKHYFSAFRFAAAVWTRKVETEGVEVKGAIREIELKPGGHTPGAMPVVAPATPGPGGPRAGIQRNRGTAQQSMVCSNSHFDRWLW